MSGEQSHDAKEQALRDRLASLDAVIVAYSGGVDSAYLAYVASRTLGDRALAVTADSPSYPDRHRRLAIAIAEQFGLWHEVIHTQELDRPEYRANPVDRCYYCKHELHTHLTRFARSGSACAGFVITTTSRASRSAATSWRARSTRSCATPSCGS